MIETSDMGSELGSEFPSEIRPRYISEVTHNLTFELCDISHLRENHRRCYSSMKKTLINMLIVDSDSP